jgi:beta-lactam-binding protein with PASTA domain
MAKKVAVPSLVGTTEDSAETALTDAGLGVIKRYVSGEPDGTVYSQEPRFPGKLAKGDLVTIDILRAPEAPVAAEPVDLSAVTKSIGELNKMVAELKASVAELKASAGTKDEIGSLGKSLQELRDAVGKAATAAVQAAAVRVQAESKESSPAPAPETPPSSTDKPEEGGES